VKPGYTVLLLITSVLSTALMSGCATNRVAHADALAQTAQLTHEVLRTPSFALTTYVRMTNPDKPLQVYIEGDGLAWVSRYQPSPDPTPVQALGLQLAATDSGPNVAYLARPCQFTPMSDNPACQSAYWTNKRFAPEVVTAMQQAITQLSHRLHQQPIHLIGYSGGGAIAVLVAANRSDIASLRTVAGNLDHVRVNSLHAVSQMPESLNAIDVASQVANIPQIHFSGAKDSIIPPDIASKFVAAVASTCASTHVIEQASHEQGWVSRWPELLAIATVCK
jgi:dienelactone hydrolase